MTGKWSLLPGPATHLTFFQNSAAKAPSHLSGSKHAGYCRAKQLLRDSFGVQNTFPSLSTIGWREMIVSDRCGNGPASTETWSYEFSLGANIFLFAPSVWYALTQLAHLLKSFIIFKTVAKTSRTYGLNLQMIKRWIRSISWLPTVNWT